MTLFHMKICLIMLVRKIIVSDTVDTENVGDESSESASKYSPMDPTVRLFKKLTNFETSV